MEIDGRSQVEGRRNQGLRGKGFGKLRGEGVRGGVGGLNQGLGRGGVGESGVGS